MIKKMIIFIFSVIILVALTVLMMELSLTYEIFLGIDYLLILIILVIFLYWWMFIRERVATKMSSMNAEEKVKYVWKSVVKTGVQYFLVMWIAALLGSIPWMMLYIAETGNVWILLCGVIFWFLLFWINKKL